MNTYTVYYKRYDASFSSMLIDGCLPDSIDEKMLANDFVPVMIVDASDREDAWLQMQSEVWSPYGEAGQAIKDFGVNHTSMSVGDILYDHENGYYYMVDMFGFKPLAYEN
jgi:hypothetical protein